MSSIAIQVEAISKQYRLGQISTGSLAHDINRWWHTVRGKENPYLKIGEENDRTRKGGEYVWALQDVSFDVNKGEVLGIIGRNGAGKSTLLKILSRTTLPTAGSIKAKGRIASLLEVGTGFHPDLSGRENIFLNGAILGMTKREIHNKFDEIVDFAGVEKYIDTPVKRYSSGMYVRLAFAVAAHLEPEILIVDEVLAVGDAEFQKKCLGKMKDVSVNEGRTVLFVSHNMSAIKQLCNKALFLDKGKVQFEGSTYDVINHYLSTNSFAASGKAVLTPSPKSDLSFSEIYITDKEGSIINNLTNNDPVIIHLEFEVYNELRAAEISICLKNSIDINVLFASLSDSFGKKLFSFQKGRHKVKVIIQDNFLFPDTYYLKVIAHEPNVKNIEEHDGILKFNVIDVGSTMAPYGPGANAVTCVLGGTQWELNHLNN